MRIYIYIYTYTHVCVTLSNYYDYNYDSGPPPAWRPGSRARPCLTIWVVNTCIMLMLQVRLR